ncbi:cytochrome P450 [Sphingomonas sp. MMS24-JH45]
MIAEGEKAIMYYGAANRDPAMFPDPDRFDIRANAEKNIAFGHGPHICIGRMTAQLQLEEAYRQIFARFPDIRWTGEMDIAPNNFVHAVRRLEVEDHAGTCGGGGGGLKIPPGTGGEPPP